MFNLSLWPHIRTRFDWRRLGLRRLLALLPAVGFGLYLWGWGLGGALLLSLGAGLAGHVLWAKKGLVRGRDFGWLSDSLLINLLMPCGISRLVPAGLTLACQGLRAMTGGRKGAYPLNFPLVLGALTLGAAGFEVGILHDRAWWAGAVFRGEIFFLSGWLPALMTIAFSLLLVGRLYKWRIPALGLLMPLAYLLYLQYRAGGLAAGQLPWLAALYLFSLGVLAVDHQSTPAGRREQAWFGMAAGIMVFLFSLRGLHWQGAVFSPVIAGLLTPLLDKLKAAGGSPAGLFGPDGKQNIQRQHNQSEEYPNG
jgi:Na+-translocating ferredoxin:NAD+ oxidoreductase RnfD subunit